MKDLFNILKDVDYSRPIFREVYRYRESTYINNNSVVTKQSWNLMKRKSKNLGQKQTMVECMKDGGDFPIIVEGGPPVHGELYECHWRTTHTDLETGGADEWDYVMRPYIEDEK